MPSANAFELFTAVNIPKSATSMPSFTCWDGRDEGASNSRGPDRQSVETIVLLQANASSKTLGNPSVYELNTRQLALEINL